MAAFRAEVQKDDAIAQQKKLSSGGGYSASRGYGGKFGVESDRMDASALPHEYEVKVEKHASQKDYAKGFGGKYGIQKDRVDKVGHAEDRLLSPSHVVCHPLFCSSLPLAGTT